MTSVLVFRMCLYKCVGVTIVLVCVSVKNVRMGELRVCGCVGTSVFVYLFLSVCRSPSKSLSHLHSPSFYCFASPMVHSLSACFPVMLVSTVCLVVTFVLCLLSWFTYLLRLSYLKYVLSECHLSFLSMLLLCSSPPPQQLVAIQQQKPN